MSLVTLASLCLFGVFIVTAVIGVPIAYTLILAGTVFIGITGITRDTMITQTMFATADNFPLLAVPFFMVAGELMAQGGIARRLVDWAMALVGSRKGGLGAIAILACMIFGAISGSGTATAAAIGGILIPIMKENSYKPEHTASIVALGGALGPIIPPSVFYILYGVIATVSVSKLFIGALIPSLIVVLSLLIVNYFQCVHEDYPTFSRKYSWREKLIVTKNSFWALLAPIVVLGGIYGGIFTPTEAAVISVTYSILVSMFIYKELDLKGVLNTFIKGLSTASAILIIMGPATLFGKMLAVARIPQGLTDALMTISENVLVFLLLTNIMLLIAGMLLEGVAILTIFSPLLVPVAQAYGVDLLHFGVIIGINLSVGLCTPPFGLNLFITSKIAGISFTNTFRHLFPLIIGTIVALGIISAFPELSLWLPRLME